MDDKDAIVKTVTDFVALEILSIYQEYAETLELPLKTLTDEEKSEALKLHILGEGSKS